MAGLCASKEECCVRILEYKVEYRLGSFDCIDPLSTRDLKPVCSRDSLPRCSVAHVA